jgi:hypothetical protein
VARRRAKPLRTIGQRSYVAPYRPNAAPIQHALPASWR